MKPWVNDTRSRARSTPPEARKKDKVSITELRSGSRRGKIPKVRAEVARKLVEDYGITIAEVARQVGVSTSGISKSLGRSYSS